MTHAMFTVVFRLADTTGESEAIRSERRESDKRKNCLKTSVSRSKTSGGGFFSHSYSSESQRKFTLSIMIQNRSIHPLIQCIKTKMNTGLVNNVLKIIGLSVSVSRRQQTQRVILN